MFLDEMYLELWNALIEYRTVDDEQVDAAWTALVEIQDRHYSLHRGDVSRLRITANATNQQLNKEPTIVLALEEPGDSEVYDGHLDKIRETYKAGQLFKRLDVERVCSVSKPQAVNILNYGIERAIVVSPKRSIYYWTE